jgi:hypothetical protein
MDNLTPLTTVEAKKILGYKNHEHGILLLPECAEAIAALIERQECKHETIAWVGNIVGCADCKTPAGVVIADLRRQIQEAQGLLISHAPDGHQYTNEQFVNMRYRAEAAETRLASIETDRDQLRDQLAEANEETSTLQTRLAAVEGALVLARQIAKHGLPICPEKHAKLVKLLEATPTPTACPECERLRGALREIAEMGDWYNAFSEVQAIARAALGSKAKEGENE